MSIIKLNQSKWTKDGRSWVFYYNYYDEDGKRKQYMSRAFYTKDEAEAAYEMYKDRLNTVGEGGLKFTLKDACEKFYEYKKDKVRRATLHSYIQRMEHLKELYDIPLVELNQVHYNKWRNVLNEKNLKCSYKQNIQKYIKMVITFAEKHYDYSLNRFYRKIEPFSAPEEIKREIRYYTPKEFYQYISQANTIYLKCLFKTLYYLGLRRGEIRGLTWDSIDFENSCVYVKKQVVQDSDNADDEKKWRIAPLKTKNSERVLPLSQDLKNDFEELLANVSSSHNFNMNWFVFGKENPVSTHKINYQNELIAKVSKVKLINIHGFRHSCASMLINNNVNVSVVSSYLGHSDTEETLNTYTHMFTHKLDEVANFIDNQAVDLACMFKKINKKRVNL